MPFLRILLTALAIALSGCATQEYRQATNECSYEAYQRYPVNNVTQVINVQRPVEVPTGQTNCTTDYIGNTANTSCRQVMRTEMRNFQQTVVADSNESYRQSAIRSCAAQKCYSRYGNADCKAPSYQPSKTKESSCSEEVVQRFGSSNENYQDRRNAYESCITRLF
jgi:hypothetical protein